MTSYGAISLDTSIFDAQGLKLESGILKTLEQFKGKPSSLVLSEIVTREVRSHIEKKAKDAKSLVEKAIKESKISLSVSDKDANLAFNTLISIDDAKEVSKKRLEKFINNTGTKIILASDHVDFNDLIKKYFQSEPPFKESGKKKNEFPDAIALISLELWAKEHKTNILAVSKDNDWIQFGENSKYIDVINDLAEAISRFQPNSYEIDFCTNIAKNLPSGNSPDLHVKIKYMLSQELANLELIPIPSSEFECENDEDVKVTLKSFQYISDKNDHALFRPVQCQNNELIVEAKVNIIATAFTSFSLSVHDSIDDDYVHLGSGSGCEEIKFNAELLLTFFGEFDEGDEYVNLQSVELLSSPTNVYFDDIEPDWRHEEE